MNDFKTLRTTKKGMVGEAIVKDHLIAKGFNVAQFEGNSAHCVDFVAHKTGVKQEWFTFEVKTKPIKSPYTTTGFNENQYNDYLGLLEGPYKLDTFVFFVDELEAMCYGAWISELKGKMAMIINDPYHRTFKTNRIYLWERHKMRDMFPLTPEQLRAITQHN
jgi:hypothetical protein